MPEAPEQRARADIDRLLGAAGWAVQDYRAADIHGEITSCPVLAFGFLRSPRAAKEISNDEDINLAEIGVLMLSVKNRTRFRQMTGQGVRSGISTRFRSKARQLGLALLVGAAGGRN